MISSKSCPPGIGMKFRLSMAMLLTIAIIVPPVWADATDNDPYLPEFSKAYDPGRDPVADGKEALEFARQTNRRVLIEAGGNWCNYCKALDRFIAENATVKNSLYERFVVLKVNVSDTNENEEFMSALPKTFGYPHFFIAESNGTVIYSDDTTGLLDNGKYSEQRFIDFLDKWGSLARAGDL